MTGSDEIDTVTATESAVIGLDDREAVDGFVARAAAELVGVEIAEVLFRSGRIDAVYGLRSTSGEAERLALKVHRPPVDLAARRRAKQVQQLLADAGFPCARPLAGPAMVDGRTVSVETLLPAGREADGHDPRIRRAIAAGLAEQVAVLSSRPELADQVGPPTAWADYRRGAWGRTHDPFFDFRETPAEYAWLQTFAQEASDTLLSLRDHSAPVVAHSDWYSGNLRFDEDRLVAAFDWDLIADREAVVAGIAAATFAGESEAGPTTPSEAAEFLHDYEQARQRGFSATERRAAAAAVRWNVAYSARCDVTNAHGSPPSPHSTVELLRTRRTEYADLSW